MHRRLALAAALLALSFAGLAIPARTIEKPRRARPAKTARTYRVLLPLVQIVGKTIQMFRNPGIYVLYSAARHHAEGQFLELFIRRTLPAACPVMDKAQLSLDRLQEGVAMVFRHEAAHLLHGDGEQCIKCREGVNCRHRHYSLKWFRTLSSTTNRFSPPLQMSGVTRMRAVRSGQASTSSAPTEHRDPGPSELRGADRPRRRARADRRGRPRARAPPRPVAGPRPVTCQRLPG